MQNSLMHDDSNHGSYTLHSLDVGNQKIKSEPSINYACVVSAEHAGANKRKTVDDSAEGEAGQVPETPRKTLPPNGKKTKGRVKIKMEFIDNKLRRYTTFSKRKTGIMKKAYELSTLTGTQVMLLVASETGHVYTFATRKLQPMITSEAGKALIQTCLNSPDPPVGPGSSGPDQRMSATGFEEVDLTYTVTEDTENKDGPKNHYQYSGSGASSPESSGEEDMLPDTPVLMSLPNASTPSFQPTTTHQLFSHTSTATTKSSAISMGAGFTTILASGNALPAGAVQIGTLQAAGQSQNGTNQQSTSHGSTLYRLPQGPLVNLPTVASHASSNSNSPVSSQGTVTVVPSSQQNLSVVSVVPTSTGGVPGAVMYQTAQGVVYATPSTLPEGVILNLGQSGTLSLQHDTLGNTTQQFIIPVALTAAQQQQLVQTSVAAGLSNRREKSRK